jgi:hypothetical protein
VSAPIPSVRRARRDLLEAIRNECWEKMADPNGWPTCSSVRHAVYAREKATRALIAAVRAECAKESE